MNKKSITSYDVAKAAGVSQSAVSRAFSPGASIAKATRDRVLQAASDLGYQPNAIARSMSSARIETQQKSGMVGVVVTRLQDPFFSRTIAGLSQNIQARGWQMLLFTVESESEVDAAMNSLMQYKIDGAIIMSAILSDQMAETCQLRGIPVMLYNRSADGLNVNSVQIDNVEGGRLAAEFLLEAGHERIAFVGGEEDDETSKARESGFVDRLSEDGIKLLFHEEGNYTFESGREAALRLFSRNQRPDAIFCASDVMALGVLHAARYELGLEVQKDFSLLGFDDIPEASWPGHSLTTIRQPIRRMIVEAVDVLVENMQDPEMLTRRTSFAGKLILRGSCRRTVL
ncbi:MAG: LacI family DNA-binding transcriptional regulator [Roseibium sp.]|uniref:LacI family DNA-binding transcriptional regulator n=1 Tax=Roseibium sp. TaxID=1936156 RepID=UPI0026171703|nr:LacI family DNA-binding transcriptional regulator [Roseibium sp.]MCV0428356.1 LacI family DNA-binding transcriptional regulator [Roseibium sp.]